MSLNDHFSPVSLAETLDAIGEADQAHDAERVCSLVKARLAEFLAQRPVDPSTLEAIIRAAREVGRLDLIARIAGGLDDAFWTLPISRPAISLMAHVNVIHTVCAGSTTATATRRWWTDALGATSEIRLVRALDQMARPQSPSRISCVTSQAPDEHHR